MSGMSPAAGVALASTGLALPAEVVTNDDLARRVETSDEWIAQRTGIRQRYLAQPGESTHSLALAAARMALERAGMSPRDLDLLILATITPEMCCPSTAARVVADLGAVPAGAMDLSAACSGFVYGMNLAWSMIRTGAARTVMVIGAETLSRITHWEDRRTCVLFGDGAGAAIFTASPDATRGCLYQSMHSDGSRWGELYVPRTAEQVLPDQAGFNGQLDTLQMNGREIYKFAVHTLQQSIEQALTACSLRPEDLAVIVPHQSNARILESAREKLGLTPEKLYINIDRYANTSAASVPLALHELHSTGRVRAGDPVLFVALGGGLTWASSLWRV